MKWSDPFWKASQHEKYWVVDSTSSTIVLSAAQDWPLPHPAHSLIFPRTPSNQLLPSVISMYRKVVLWDRDVKAMCSVAKCKQSKWNLIEHLLYCWPLYGNWTVISRMVSGPKGMNSHCQVDILGRLTNTFDSTRLKIINRKRVMFWNIFIWKMLIFTFETKCKV